MKSTASIQRPVFLNSALPMTTSWGDSPQRAPRPAPRVPVRFALDTDELAASKQEVVCGGILALCLVYTLAHVVAQFAF